MSSGRKNIFRRQIFSRRFAGVFVLAVAVFLQAIRSASPQESLSYPFMEEYDSSRSILARISPPVGYERIWLDSDSSYGVWIRGLPLKPEESPVLMYNGDRLAYAEDVVAVVDLDIPNDMYQCADVAMRLWAEYLWSQNRQEEIRFRTLGGDHLIWTEWRKRSRLTASHQNFLRFLDGVAEFCNTSSLARDLPVVASAQVQPGDMYIQPDPSGHGGIGHLSIIFDMAKNDEGQKLYLVGYGFMPAQDVHIVRPNEGEGSGDWFTLEGYERHISGFGAGQYHRFE